MIKTGRGFSIVELLVAIVVGGLFLASLNLAIGNYLHLEPKVRSLVIANSYVEGKIEALRNQGYNALGIGTSDVSAELPAELNSPRSASLQISSQSTGLKKIGITLNYNDQGTNRSYSYTTYVGELGVGKQ